MTTTFKCAFYTERPAWSDNDILKCNCVSFLTEQHHDFGKEFLQQFTNEVAEHLEKLLKQTTEIKKNKEKKTKHTIEDKAHQWIV